MYHCSMIAVEYFFLILPNHIYVRETDLTYGCSLYLSQDHSRAGWGNSLGSWQKDEVMEPDASKSQNLTCKTFCPQLKISYKLFRACFSFGYPQCSLNPESYVNYSWRSVSDSMITSPSHAVCKEKVRRMAGTRVCIGPGAFILPGGRLGGKNRGSCLHR